MGYAFIFICFSLGRYIFSVDRIFIFLAVWSLGRTCGKFCCTLEGIAD